MKSINKLLSGLAAGLLLASFPAIAADHSESPPIHAGVDLVLEVEGVRFARFSSVEGLGARIEVLEFRDGGEGGLIRKIPGQTKYDNITLKRGLVAGDDLWSWLQQIIDGDFVSRNASIVLLADNGSEVARYNLYHAWPISYHVGVGSDRGSSAAIESLTLAVERVEFD